jgi:hypothetical protein
LRRTRLSRSWCGEVTGFVRWWVSNLGTVYLDELREWDHPIIIKKITDFGNCSVIVNHIKEVPRTLAPPNTSPRNTHMPKSKKAAQSTVKPDSDTGQTRMTTRASNATAHPGNVLRGGSHVRRSKEEVQEAKKMKEAKKEEKEKRMADAKALEAAGKAFVAQREAEDNLNASAFPRHRNETRGMGIRKSIGRSMSNDCFVGKANVPAPKRKVFHVELGVRLLESYYYAVYC